MGQDTVSQKTRTANRDTMIYNVLNTLSDSARTKLLEKEKASYI